jgi:hypothetical protein
VRIVEPFGRYAVRVTGAEHFAAAPEPQQAEIASDAMRDILGRLCGTVTRAELVELQRQLRANEAPDYDVAAFGFASTYHDLNFRKVLAALEEAAPGPVARIVDLGTGSAAAAAAALVHLTRYDLQLVEVELIDNSKVQLDLAGAIVEALRPQLPFKLEVTAVTADVTFGDLADDTPALVLVSHVLTENPQGHVTQLLERAQRHGGPGGAVLVIERSDDWAWPIVADYVGRSLCDRGAGSLAVTHALPDQPARDWQVSWLLLRRPVNDALPRAARRYFDAWLKQDPAALSGVFTATARYKDKPFSPDIAGIEGIQRYWVEHVVPQSELSISFGSVAYGPWSVHVEWTARFVRDNLRRVVAGAMVLDVEPRTGLIRELREWYHSAPSEDVHVGERRPRPGDR